MAPSKKTEVNINTSSKETKTPINLLLSKSDVLLMIYPRTNDGIFLKSIESEDELVVYDLVRNKNETKNNLVIFLDTSGGNVYSAVKIMDCLRHYYKHIIIAVAQSAKSSGTMMCFGADQLIMSPISELGPLDKPLRHPDNESSFISALDIVHSLDDTIEQSIANQSNMAEELRRRFSMRMKSSLEISSDFVSKLFSPMLQHEDIKIYNQAKRLLAIAETYGKELLNKYMFGYIKDDKLRSTLIRLIIRQFVWLYPDHAFAIRRSELVDRYFKVIFSEDLDYWNDLWNEYKKHSKGVAKTIKFLE